MPEPLASRIVEILRPMVGSVLAAASVDVESRRIGKTSETIEREDLDGIASNLSRRLTSFVGEKLAESAARRVRDLA